MKERRYKDVKTQIHNARCKFLENNDWIRIIIFYYFCLFICIPAFAAFFYKLFFIYCYSIKFFNFFFFFCFICWIFYFMFSFLLLYSLFIFLFFFFFVFYF